MNKVININISGMVFHIDEEAFDVLNRYLESLKRHFKNTDGGDEIMADIESRIAEMLTENLKSRTEVVSMANVNQVMASMGQPEEMQDDENEKAKNTGRRDYNINFNPGKRVYRDKDHKIVAGVCSGISEYFGVDPLWLRLIFAVITVLGFGFGLIIYIILWAILPVAETPSEKLEMRGERVNISNIEKAVKENLETIKTRIDEEFRQFDGKNVGRKFNYFFSGLFEGVSTGLRGVFFVIARILGFFILFVSVMAIISVICFVLGFFGIMSLTVPAAFYDFFDNHQQSAITLALFAFVLVLPFVALFIRIIRYMAGYKRRNRALAALFGTLWFIAFVVLALMIFTNVSNYKKSDAYTIVDKLKKPAHDTLYLAINNNGNVKHHYHGYGDIELDQVWRHIKSPDNNSGFGIVTLDITRSTDNSISLEKQYYSRGKTNDEAHDLAQTIQYSFLQRDSLITFDEGFRINPVAKWRGQSVELTLHIPDGTVILLNKGMENIIYDVENTSDTWDGDMIGYKWKMTPAGLTCIDCPQEPNTTHRHRWRRSWHVGRNYGPDSENI
jgi:phage shock protein PspC (stress-responsive transcriptional regulator)